MTENDKLKWGLIGASNVAREWLHGSIQKNPNCEVVAVYGRDKKRTDEFASELGIQGAYTDLHALLADPNVNAVYISTTNERHKEEAIAAAKAGKHILCEKPLALTVQDAQEMVEAANAAGVVFATNYHLRNLETHRAIKDVIRSGELGKITSAHVAFTVNLPDELARWRLYDPKLGAGVLLDLTVHDMDLLRFYFDADPLSVTAMGLTSGNAPAGVKDNVMSLWEFPGGLLVGVHDSFLVPQGGTSVHVHGTRASVYGDNVMWQKAQGSVVLQTGNGDRSVPVEHLVPYDRTISDFVSAVRGKGEPSVSGEDGIASLRLALAAQKSMETGRTVRIQQV